MNKAIKITNGKVIMDKVVEKNLYIRNGQIEAITNEELPFDELIDAKGKYVSPGFIDTHVHGGGGFDFMDEGEESVVKAARAHMKHGTTTILPTTLSESLGEIMTAVDNIREAAKEEDVPHIYGAHLEGPWLAMSQKGAMNPEFIIPPRKEEYERVIEAGKGCVKKVTFAPELEGAEELCRYLKENNIIPSAGHTEATIEDIKACRKMGLDMVTHLYSSMSTITRRDGYRIPGTVEAAYCFDDMYAEVIADGIHLPPDLLKLIYKIKGADRICLITDAMRGADMPEGKSYLGSMRHSFECIIEDGIAKLPDRTCFAGSVATTDRCVRVFKDLVGVPIEEAVKMMTKTPAIAHGIKNKGEIKEGYDADLLIFDENIEIEKIILKTNNNIKIYEGEG